MYISVIIMISDDAFLNQSPESFAGLHIFVGKTVEHSSKRMKNNVGRDSARFKNLLFFIDYGSNFNRKILKAGYMIGYNHRSQVRLTF